jgi:sulfite reductase (NADPH) hemoprotein beta-component
MNGVYLQLHAYMLRIADSLRHAVVEAAAAMLAHVARKYDRGYGHFTTRQNIQFNWIKLSDIPDDRWRDLASVEHARHADQSGNCIRNVTSDQWAGVVRRRGSRTRVSGRRSCASGRRCIRNSRSCRASSRFAVTGGGA